MRHKQTAGQQRHAPTFRGSAGDGGSMPPTPAAPQAASGALSTSATISIMMRFSSKSFGV